MCNSVPFHDPRPFGRLLPFLFGFPCRGTTRRSIAFGLAVLVPLLAMPGGAWAEAGSSNPDVRPAVRSQQFESWALRCVASKAGGSEPVGKDASARCEIAQSIQVDRDGARVEALSLAVSRAEEKAGKAEWSLVALTPLDVHLPSDFGLSIRSLPPIPVRYRNCNHLGCFAVAPVDASLVTKMRAASEGTALFRLLNGRAVKIVFPLRGFSKAFDGLAAGVTPKTVVETGGAAVPHGEASVQK